MHGHSQIRVISCIEMPDMPLLRSLKTAFCGKFCVAAVRTLERNITGDWEQVAANSTVVSECMVDMSEGDEDEEG